MLDTHVFLVQGGSCRGGQLAGLGPLPVLGCQGYHWQTFGRFVVSRQEVFECEFVCKKKTHTKFIAVATAQAAQCKSCAPNKNHTCANQTNLRHCIHPNKKERKECKCKPEYAVKS